LDSGSTPQTVSRPLLDSGPIPLTVRDARWWAVGLVGLTLAFGLLLPAVALRVAATNVPPDAFVFGEASVIPAPGWELESASADSVKLTKNGVWAEFESGPYSGSAFARTLELAAQMQEEYPDLTASSDPRTFDTPLTVTGRLQALAAPTRTSVVAAVVDSGISADVTSLGESVQFGDAVGELQEMLESIRIQPDARNG